MKHGINKKQPIFLVKSKAHLIYTLIRNSKDLLMMLIQEIGDIQIMEEQKNMKNRLKLVKKSAHAPEDELQVVC